MSPPGWTLNVQPHQWPSLRGTAVEVWLHGRLYRQGLVDAVMPDGSGLWLAADGGTAGSSSAYVPETRSEHAYLPRR